MFAERYSRQRQAVGKILIGRGPERRQIKPLGELGRFAESNSRPTKADGKQRLCREPRSRRTCTLGKDPAAVTWADGVTCLPRAPPLRLSANCFAERHARQTCCRVPPLGKIAVHMCSSSPLLSQIICFNMLQSFLSLHMLSVVLKLCVPLSNYLTNFVQT